MAGRREEIDAGVDTCVMEVHQVSLDFQLLLEVGLKLLVDVLNDWPKASTDRTNEKGQRVLTKRLKECKNVCGQTRKRRALSLIKKRFTITQCELPQNQLNLSQKINWKTYVSDSRNDMNTCAALGLTFFLNWPLNARERLFLASQCNPFLSTMLPESASSIRVMKICQTSDVT